jgi:hypothetical protein
LTIAPAEEPPRAPALRARRILETLAGHRLDYVVIGGVAAAIWGSPRNTEDLDICPSEESENLARLADVLNELDARFRSPELEAGFTPPARWDDKRFGSFTSLSLVTKHGWLDVWFRPDGTRGYRDLIEHAAEAEFRGVRVQVADLDDVIRSKTAAGRERDLEAIPHLLELQQRRKLRG